MYKKGFTLAEILMAITITGVVAALTLPALKSNIDESVWMESLKADRAMLERAFHTMMVDAQTDTLDTVPIWYGSETNMNIISEPQLGITPTENDSMQGVNRITPQKYENNVNSTTMESEMKKYLNFDNMITLSSSNVEDYPIAQIKSNNSLAYPTENTYRFEMANSSAVTIEFLPIITSISTVQLNGLATSSGLIDSSSNPFAKVYIDTNGKKGPNMAGKDIFYFVLNEDGKLLPFGSSDAKTLLQSNYDSDYNNSDVSKCPDTDSRACTQKVILDGYKIKY